MQGNTTEHQIHGESIGQYLTIPREIFVLMGFEGGLKELSQTEHLKLEPGTWLVYCLTCL